MLSATSASGTQYLFSLMAWRRKRTSSLRASGVFSRADNILQLVLSRRELERHTLCGGPGLDRVLPRISRPRI